MFDSAKKFIPASVLKKIRPLWHGFLAYLAAWYYKYPARRMIVIGVTGTAGKSTTVQMLAAILNSAGKKTGYITTVEFFDGQQHWQNKHGLSMPGRFALQKSLALMLKNDCQIAIIETTSEGLAQNRHLAVDFDIALLTNIAQAHIQAHGGFENYRRAKARLFLALRRSYFKEFFKHKIIGVNLDDERGAQFANLAELQNYPDLQKFGITFSQAGITGDKFDGRLFKAAQLSADNGRWQFILAETLFKLQIPGIFNAHNALLALACANVLGVELPQSAAALQNFKEISGRMQEIKNSRGIKIFLDYAPEPIAMENALSAVAAMRPKKIIHVFGSTGGHRDVQKRFEFGEISARHADTIIITNDDVYDSDPEQIASDVKAGIERSAPKRVGKIEIILDRAKAIEHAISQAEAGDTVLITGKGSEQFLVLPGNRRIAWDEKSVIEKAL